MHPSTQVELIRRFQDGEREGEGPRAPTPYRCPPGEYTSAVQLAEERRILLRGAPTMVALTADVPNPGAFVATEGDGIPLLVVRGDDGRVRVFLNACRHRGAPVAEGRGDARRVLTCPYHSWSYRTTGALHRRPTADDCYPGIDPADLGLVELPSDEAHGIVAARLDGEGTVDVDAWLGDAAPELASYGLAGYHHVETRSQRRAVNWKLVVDTFLEAYHIFSLHHRSIAPQYYSDPALFDAFGDHFRLIGVRRSIDELGDDESEWSLIPHATIHYTLFPNGLVVHQMDHVEVWRVYPDGDDPHASVIVTGLYAPAPPRSDRERSYWIKNLDLLLGVTDTEDFPQCEAIQRALRVGAVRELVFGENEPALAHFHSTLRRSLGMAEAHTA